MRDRILVTGGAGAIGSRLVVELLRRGNEVEVWDDLSSGHRWLVPEGVHFHKLDVVEHAEAFDWRGGDVFHLAAHFANQNSVDHPLKDLRVNGYGTLALIQASPPSKRFVFASAGCAAGHEDTPYQIHKTLGESYCRYYGREYFRFHNSYGPGEVPGKYRNVIPNLIWKCVHNEKITIYGDGKDCRDFVFVDDVVGDLLDTKGPKEIGTGVLTSINTLVDMVRSLTESSSDVVHGPKRRWDHPGRAAEETRPRRSLESGIQETIGWFANNYERIKPCVSW